MNCPVLQKIRRPICAAIAVAICVSAFCISSFAVAQTAPTRQTTGVQTPSPSKWLVLNNGQLLEGKIERAQGKYIVVAASGSRIVIADSNVNFVADSIEDIYWEKWSRVNPTDADSHTRLFRWCLKHGLLEQAQKQIELVAKIEKMDDQASQLSRMAQELDLVVTRIEKEALLAQKKEIEALNIRQLPKLPEMQQSGNSQFAAAPTIPSVPIDAEGRPVRTLKPTAGLAAEPAKPENKIGLVDFQQDLAVETKPEKRNKPAWVSNRKLDRETRMMPDGTVSFYRRHLESKLVSNCIQCHDSRSIEMPLNKRSIGQTIPRRMSQQNMHFVMEQVDRSNPLASRLLTMATTAHGKQKVASFKSNDPFLFELKKWTVAVSEDPAKWLMTLSQQTLEPQTEAQAEPEMLNKAALSQAAKAEPVANEIIVVDPEPTDVDPYDPSAFNRK